MQHKLTNICTEQTQKKIDYVMTFNRIKKSIFHKIQILRRACLPFLHHNTPTTSTQSSTLVPHTRIYKYPVYPSLILHRISQVFRPLLFLLPSPASPPSLPPPSAPPRPRSRPSSPGQRWGTWLLRWPLPGTPQLLRA